MPHRLLTDFYLGYTIKYLFLLRSITRIQTIKDFLRNVISIIGIQQIIKTRIADDKVVSFILVVSSHTPP